MDFQSFVERFGGYSTVCALDIMPDGSSGDLLMIAVNRANAGLLRRNPKAPEFYSGIPWRAYFTDVNLESYCYRCVTENKTLYSYVNAHNRWLKGLYIPLSVPEQEETDGKKRLYLLYILDVSKEMDSESMSQRSAEISNTVINISVKLHQTQNYHEAMAAVTHEIKTICGAESCSIYTVDTVKQHCNFINESGVHEEWVRNLSFEMHKTPYEIALEWEEDLAGSDCLLLDELSVIKERDPLWYESLKTHGIRNIILYAVRYNQTLVGFIWAMNFDATKLMQIKETLEMTTFLLGAVISNHQLVARLEEKSTVDGLTQVSNRNAMNERIDGFTSGRVRFPQVMGVAFADLNGLKTVNDDEGHEAGDRLLKRAASLLKIAFGDYEIYRAGGDEFVIFCLDITEEKFNAQVAQLRALADNTTDVSFAVGTVYCTGEYNIASAMQTADENMYKDKKEYYRLHPEKDRRKQKR